MHKFPPSLIIPIIVLAAIQIPLQIWGLLDLSRRERVPGGKKWVWVLIILVGNLVGAIIYLAVGRTPGGSDDGGRAGGEGARRRAVDRLYGDPPR